MNAILLPELLPYLKDFESISFKEGETVVHSNDPLSGMFFIIKGYVKEVAVSEHGMELTLNIFGSGYCFPLSLLLLDKPSSNDLISLTTVKAIHLPKKLAFSFLKNNSQILADISKKLTSSMLQTTKKLELLVFGDSHEKILYSLSELARYFGKRSGNKIIINKRFTHYDIATIAGLTRETTSKILEDLGKKGLIEYKDRKLIITDISIFKQLI